MSYPGFTAQQTASLQAFIDVTVKAAVAAAFQATSGPVTHQIIALQPAPLVAPQPLQQPNAEDIAEKDTEKPVNSNNTTTVTTSLHSTILHQATKQMCREFAFRLNNTPFLASLLAFFLAFASPPGYIRFAEDMNATGQG